MYPQRHRPDDKFEAWLCWLARMKEKVNPETLIACASEYEKEERRLGKVGTEFVLRAATFLGPRERYLAYLPKAEPPRAAAKPVAPAEPRVDARPYLREILANLSVRRMP